MTPRPARPLPKALRPVDLARMAGVSTQLVRDYADAGILPPTPRTPSGYRRFAPVHGRALLAYRALAKGFGPDTARAVMRAVHADDVPLALTLLDAAHAELHASREALRVTGEALEAVAREGAEGPGAAGSGSGSAAAGSGSAGSRAAVAAAPSRADLTVGEVAARVGVRASALRVWESAGLLAPARERGTGYRRYDAADVRDARMISMLRQAGYALPAIRPVLDGLRETGGSEALRAALARRQAELTRRSRAMLAGAGLLAGYVGGAADETEQTGTP
ncbi:MerR family transcriptional regulator [Streptomyces alboflavus]|uniref:MerR family transcriptional regulator n=1 Tax=Streptomyces alboflavus TaxID=67267 RepID=UPI0036B81FC6